MGRRIIVDKHPGIRIDKIPVKGWTGLLFVVTTLLIFLIGVPASRPFLLISLTAGLIGGVGLYLWRRHTG